MSVVQASRPSPMSNAPFSARHPWRRMLILCLLLLLSVVLYIILSGATPRSDDLIAPFLQVWMLSFLPYFVACAFVLATKPAAGRWRWIELGIILFGALIFRIMLLPLPPGLSHDAWRYLWDARVLLHGYSPYVYAPWDKVLLPLRDNLLYANSRFRNVPTIYPPGAEAIYVLSYLLAPSNLYFLKGIFIVFDMVTCGALVLLLKRKGLDPRRVIIYAWCPLPIIEFAIQGHVDVITLTFTVLAVVSAANTRPGGRVLTGILIGLATLTKIYPILLLVVIARRRDYVLFAACFITIIVGYLPFLILGHGQAFGYFTIYASEQGQNAGVTQLLVQWLGERSRIPLTSLITIEHVVDVVLVSVVSLVILILRQRDRITIEAGVLLLFGVVLSISSHVFPWYTTTFLLWVPLVLGKISPMIRLPITHIFQGRCNSSQSVGTRFIASHGVGKGAVNGRMCAHLPPFPTPWDAINRVPTLWSSLCSAQDMGNDEPVVGDHPVAGNNTPTTGDHKGPLPAQPHPRPYGSSASLWASIGTNLAIVAVWYFSCTSILSYFFTAAPDWTLYYRLVYDPVMIALGVAAIIGIVYLFTHVPERIDHAGQQT